MTSVFLCVFSPLSFKDKFPQLFFPAGNHFVWEFLPGKGTLNVPNEVAFLHHYRVCEFGGDDCVRNPRTTDVSMYRYKDRLVKSYSTNMAQLGRQCGVEASSKEKALWTLQ